MTSSDQTESLQVNDIYDDIRDGLKHTGSKEILRLFEDEVSDNNNIIDSIVQMIINKVQNIEEKGDSNSKIIKILGKLGKLGQRITLLEDTIKDLNEENTLKYLKSLEESYSYDDKEKILSINETLKDN